MKILLTGAVGFVGQALAANLVLNSSCSVIGAVRKAKRKPMLDVPLFSIGDINRSTDWSCVIKNIDVVVHLAARAHVTGDDHPEPLLEYRRINVDGTLALARQAIDAGVKRFVFLSSIGVNGSYNSGIPFNESAAPAPHADYALSKLEAEQRLCELVKNSDMELVVIRPPLVYAGHAPGNFNRLLKIVASGVPLPFAAVKNKRSMVALENLVNFISLCIEHPAAADQLFLVSDGVDFSTPEIIRCLAAGMGKEAWLYPLPDALMYWGASLTGKQALYTQLCGSLTIDSTKACNALGWKPHVAPAEAMFKAGRDFKLAQLAGS